MAITRAPQNKSVFAAAPEPESVGRLARGHGVACCPGCGQVVATCGHLGHGGLIAPPIPCARCTTGGG